MSQVIAESDFRYLEMLPDGRWLARYAVIPVGFSSSGERLLSFGSSEYSYRPSVVQLLKSISRYAEAFKDNDRVVRSLQALDISNYFTYE